NAITGAERTASIDRAIRGRALSGAGGTSGAMTFEAMGLTKALVSSPARPAAGVKARTRASTAPIHEITFLRRPFTMSSSSLRKARRSENVPAPLNELNRYRDDGEHQKEVNEPSKCVGAHQTHGPQHHQYNGDCPEH